MATMREGTQTISVTVIMMICVLGLKGTGVQASSGVLSTCPYGGHCMCNHSIIMCDCKSQAGTIVYVTHNMLYDANVKNLTIVNCDDVQILAENLNGTALMKKLDYLEAVIIRNVKVLRIESGAFAKVWGVPKFSVDIWRVSTLYLEADAFRDARISQLTLTHVMIPYLMEQSVQPIKNSFFEVIFISCTVQVLKKGAIQLSSAVPNNVSTLIFHNTIFVEVEQQAVVVRNLGLLVISNCTFEQLDEGALDAHQIEQMIIQDTAFDVIPEYVIRPHGSDDSTSQPNSLARVRSFTFNRNNVSRLESRAFDQIEVSGEFTLKQNIIKLALENSLFPKSLKKGVYVNQNQFFCNDGISWLFARKEYVKLMRDNSCYGPMEVEHMTLAKYYDLRRAKESQ